MADVVERYDADRFLEDMKRNIDAQYARFRTYQDATAKTFDVFHRICIRNNIPYYLAFGSLLGAIRSGGQIPWDYDIDILVPYSVSMQLIEALDRELPDEFHYNTRIKDKHCRHYGIKIAPKEYNPEILHVDIFWLIGESDEEKTQKSHLRTRILFFKKFLYKFPDTGIESKESKTAKLMFYINRFRYGILPGGVIEKKYLKVLKTGIKADGWCATSGREKAILRTSWFSEPQLITMRNGREVCIPKETESILRAMYGDYSVYPPLKQRIKEFEHSLNRLMKFAKNKEYKST